MSCRLLLLKALETNTICRGDRFSTEDKARIVAHFTKANIRHMRKPHAASLHVTPILNLLNVDWQKVDTTEEDLIKV